MSANSEIILNQNVHPGDSTVESITGEKFKGDGYYGRSDGVHTVQYTVNGFRGEIKIQGTLSTTPVAADWSTIDTFTNVDGTFTSNFTGNFVWVRVIVENWTDGSIESIYLNH